MTLPTPAPARVPAIDILRGFAVLGILVMNIQAFSMPEDAYLAPTVHGDFGGANFAVWVVSKALVDQKFMTLFSLLFGVGIGLQLSRVDRPAAVHFRRMGVLLGIGLLHAYFVWYGDVLVPYAICGMLLYPLRRLRVGWLLGLGVIVLALHSAVFLVEYGGMGGSGGATVRQAVEALRFQRLLPAQEIAVYTGSYWSGMQHRAPAALEAETRGMVVYSLWRVAGLALLGMAAVRAGVFARGFGLGRLALPWMAAAGVGAWLTARGITTALEAGWQGNWYYKVGLLDYWGSLLVGLAWAGLVLWACRGRWGGLLAPLAAVGRMSLTNYLLQSIICTAIFYGWGLGWFGKVERLGQIQIVMWVWVFEIVFSVLWMRSFRFGPAEWVWRSLTYGRRQPWRVQGA